MRLKFNVFKVSASISFQKKKNLMSFCSPLVSRPLTTIPTQSRSRGPHPMYWTLFYIIRQSNNWSLYHIYIFFTRQTYISTRETTQFITGSEVWVYGTAILGFRLPAPAVRFHGTWFTFGTIQRSIKRRRVHIPTSISVFFISHDIDSWRLDDVMK